jgi:hypothetical protein
MTTIRLSLALALLPVAVLPVLSACSRADNSADLQQRLAAAEARADAAEKQARIAEAAAQRPAPPPQPEPVPGDNNGNGEFGQPMNDTNPIEPNGNDNQPAIMPPGPGQLQN